MKIVGIIPARYASSRLEGKPLAKIGDKTMIQLVYEQVKKVDAFDAVVVATDDDRIKQEVLNFKGEVVMTSVDCPSGTDRCAEVVAQLEEEFDYVINVQGDEPFLEPTQISGLASILDGEVEIGTLVKVIENEGELFDVARPKVVLNAHQHAVYFSRNTIPFLRNIDQKEWLSNHTFYKHIGVYAYRTDILKRLTALPQSSLELAESLEQLRWLENGFQIKVAQTTHESFGIDTPEDLEKARRLVE